LRQNQIIFSSEAAVQARLAASTVRQTINTSFVEHNNLTCRQCNGRLAHKVLSFSKDLTWLEKHLRLSLAYYHFVLAHDSLSQRLSEPQPTRGSGSQEVATDHACHGSRANGARMDYGGVAELSRASGLSRPT
jgi:hypothetical protein